MRPRTYLWVIIKDAAAGPRSAASPLARPRRPPPSFARHLPPRARASARAVQSFHRDPREHRRCRIRAAYAVSYVVRRWFQAMESRPTYIGTRSDAYTHAHDLPPQVRGIEPTSRSYCYDMKITFRFEFSLRRIISPMEVEMKKKIRISVISSIESQVYSAATRACCCAFQALQLGLRAAPRTRGGGGLLTQWVNAGQLDAANLSALSLPAPAPLTRPASCLPAHLPARHARVRLRSWAAAPCTRKGSPWRRPSTAPTVAPGGCRCRRCRRRRFRSRTALGTTRRSTDWRRQPSWWGGVGVGS